MKVWESSLRWVWLMERALCISPREFLIRLAILIAGALRASSFVSLATKSSRLNYNVKRKDNGRSKDYKKTVTKLVIPSNIVASVWQTCLTDKKDELSHYFSIFFMTNKSKQIFFQNFKKTCLVPRLKNATWWINLKKPTKNKTQ